MIKKLLNMKLYLQDHLRLQLMLVFYKIKLFEIILIEDLKRILKINKNPFLLLITLILYLKLLNHLDLKCDTYLNIYYFILFIINEC